MTNIPYEERIKNRDNDWYYNKCIRQYHFIIKAEGANQRYKEEIARLNKIIEEIENYCKLQIDYLFDLSKIPTLKEIAREHNTMLLDYRNILEKIQELKEEGKSQEIPLFEGTMEQLDNLTILKGEGNKDK